ncbi:MAG: T9SS type A sorting domain-containing protein [Bacteroidetes bacterium]|nr:T9SS type A sorting domain-containing protein [Bacteroidota bacterium]
MIKSIRSSTGYASAIAILAISLFFFDSARGQGTDVQVADSTSFSGSQLVAQDEVALIHVPGASAGQHPLLLCAYNDKKSGGKNLGFAISTDGGVTWRNDTLRRPSYTTIPVLPPGISQSWADAFDPSVAADTKGNLFISQITTDNASGGYNALHVYNSTNNGVSWTRVVVDFQLSTTDMPQTCNPNIIFHNFNDREQMVVDLSSNSSRKDNVYLAWIFDKGACQSPSQKFSDIMFSRSTNAGGLFSAAVRINDAGNTFGNAPVPAVARNGTVYVCWLNYDVATNGSSGGTAKIYIDSSTNGGVNWGTDLLISDMRINPLNLNSSSSNGSTKSFGAAVLAISPTTSNELYVVFTMDSVEAGGNPDDQGDIMFTSSSNAGQSWTTPIQINDDNTTSEQHLPWMEVRPDGTIDVIWYDRRNDATNKVLWDVYHSQSSDNGQTWSTNIKINDIAFTRPTGGNSMGEYLGLTTTNSNRYMVWTTSVADSTGDIFFDRIPFEIEEANIIASNASLQDRFGNSVYVSANGNTMVVGANLADSTSGLNNAGEAYVFERNAGGSNNWGEVARLIPSSPGAADFFGEAVAVSEDGSTIVVGAPFEDSTGNCSGTCSNSGAAYVYQRPSGGWASVTSPISENAKLTASTAITGNNFGFRVSISGNTIAVASFGGFTTLAAGHVFVRPSGSNGWGLTSSPSNLNEDAKMISSGSTFSDGFGISISISGNVVVVGAHGENTARGAAYVFVEPSSGWASASTTLNEQAKLLAQSGTSFDFFGHSVSIDGDYIAVGSPFALPGTDNLAGSAYIFKKPSGGWSGTINEEVKLLAPDGNTGDEFGNSVSIHGEKVVIGAIKDSDQFFVAGSAYIFERPTTLPSPVVWNFKGKLTASNAAIGDGFGGSVSISGNINIGEVAIGISAPFKNVGRGSAYVFRVPFAFPDSDGDGIANNIDSLPNTPSNGFTDVPLGGKTAGTITNRADRAWHIFDIGGNGVQIRATAGSTAISPTVTGNPSPCSPQVTNTIPAGGSTFNLICGSVRIECIEGTVESSASAGGVNVTAIVGPGNIITFDTIRIDSMVVFVDETSSSDVTVIVKGTEFMFTPGGTDTFTICSGVKSNIALDGNSILCQGESVTLDAGEFESYLWSTGDTTQTITVNSTGDFTVAVTDIDNCSGGSDTASILKASNPVVDLGSCRTVFLGYAPQACADLTASVTSGTAPFTYNWSTGETTSKITVCPDVTTTFTVIVSDANNCKDTAEVLVNVVDVRCGKNSDKVSICHHAPGKSGKVSDVCVSVNSIVAHLNNHGDHLLPCGTSDPCGSSKVGKYELHTTNELTLDAYPNPFNSSTTIKFSIPENGVTSVELYNLTGVKLKTLFDTKAGAGQFYEIELNRGELANGIYVITILTENGEFASIKLVMLD